MDFNNLFEEAIYASVQEVYIYQIALTTIFLVNTFMLIKGYRKIKSQNSSIIRNPVHRNFYFTLVALWFWVIGSLIGNTVRILSNFEKQIFSSEDNFFIAIGFAFSAIFFVRYLSLTLTSPFFKNKEKWWSWLFGAITILFGVTGLIMVIRVSLLAFNPIEFREDTTKIMSMLTILVLLVGLAVCLIATWFLIKERRFVPAKAKKAQVLFYLLVPFSLIGAFFTGLFIQIGSLSEGFSGIPLSIILFSLSSVGIIGFYIGTFPSKKLLIMLRVLPKPIESPSRE